MSEHNSFVRRRRTGLFAVLGVVAFCIGATTLKLAAQNPNPPPGTCEERYQVWYQWNGSSLYYCTEPKDTTPPCIDSGEGDCPDCPPGSDGDGCSGCPPGNDMMPGKNSGPGSFLGGVPAGVAMPAWRVSEPNINVWLHDKPFFYRPSRGPEVSFRLNFKNVSGANGEIDTAQPGIFGVGTNWHTAWRCYIENASGDRWFAFLGDGSARQYYTNTVDYYSRSMLCNPGTDLYTLTLASGVKYTFNKPVTLNGNSYNFLTKLEDASGNTVQFSYSTPNNGLRLTNVIDVDGKNTTFTYTNTGYYSNLISTISGPNGLTCSLAYSTNGQFTNITDIISLSSQMVYDSSNRLSKLITPYGTNKFDYYVSTSTTNWTAIRVTELEVRQQLYVEGASTTSVLPSAASEYASLAAFLVDSSMAQTFDSSDYDARNTVFWGPRQYGNLPSGTKTSLDNGSFDPSSLSTNDYQKGRLRHWLKNRGSSLVGSTLSLQRDPSPSTTGNTEGLLTWYDYADKNAGTDSEGKMMLPRYEAKRNPGGPWRIVYTERNVLGKPTTFKETYTDGSGSVLWRTATFEYAANLIDMTKRTFGSESISNVYNGFHEIVTNYNALSEVTTYAYNANNQLTNRVSLTGLATDYTYDANGWLAAMIDHAGSVWFRTNSFTYTNGLVYTQTDPSGLTVTNTWDTLGRLLTMRFSDGTGVTNAYDKLDLLVTRDRLGFTNGYAYDGFRQLIRQTNANGKVTTYQYCNCGSLDSRTDPLGNATSFSYDNQGRRTRITYPGNSGNIYVDYTLDALSEATVVAENTGFSTTNFFTVNGLIYSASNSFGRVFFRVFNDHDRYTWEADQNGSKSTFVYDELGRLTNRTNHNAVVDPGWDMYSWETFYYSANISAPTGHDELAGFVYESVPHYTSYTYDLFGRKTNEIRYSQLGGTALTTNSFSFSPAGDLLTLADGKNQTTTWKYDQYGQVTNKLDANSAEMFRYKYDADGRLTNRWTPAKTNTFYSYDGVGNLTKITYPVSSNITLKYDANNRLTNMVDAAGTTAYNYTSFGALLSEDGPWANDTVTYSYDNGRRRSGLNLQAPNASDWVQSYGYDAANRLSSLTSPAGTFSYQYSAGVDSIPSPSGLVQRLSLPNAAYITNSYDDWGRMLSTVLKNSANSVLNSHSYVYNELNQRRQQTRTDGSYVDYTYDNLEQLASANGYESGGTTKRLHEQFSYGYDLGGNLTNRTQNLLTNSFTVNNLNELSGGARAGNLTVAGTTTSSASSVTVNSLAAIRYADNTFARTNLSLADGTNTFTAVAQDSLGRGDTNSVDAYLPATVSFSYDANGNLLTDGRRFFDYDDENQLVRVTLTNATKSEFTYDGKMRRRIRKEFTWQSGLWCFQSETRYVYDGNLVVEERDEYNLPTLVYTRGADLSGSMDGAGGIGGLLALSDLQSPLLNPSHYFYHADNNGNVTMLINSVQLAAAKYIYDPFGNTLSYSGPLAERNLYRFSSKEAHPSSGLAYYLYRYYDSNLQRWLSRDPIAEEGRLNLYAYACNDPADQIDLYGEMPILIIVIVSGILIGYFLQEGCHRNEAENPHDEEPNPDRDRPGRPPRVPSPRRIPPRGVPPPGRVAP